MSDKKKRPKKQYFCELTEYEAEHLSDKRAETLRGCGNSGCFDCYGDRELG